jgi:hypothetical protein
MIRAPFVLSANALALAWCGILSHMRNPRNLAVYAVLSFAAIALVAVAVHISLRRPRDNAKRVYTKWK